MNDTQKGYAGEGNARKPSDRRAQMRAPMTARVLEFITPAPFPSLRKTRLARLLSPILWCGLILTLLFAIASTLLVSNSGRLMEVNAAFFVIHAISILILQRRVVVASAAFYASSLWLAVLVVTAMYGSVTESGVASLLTVTLVAGVLLGPKVSLGFVGLSTLGIAVIAALERSGQLPIFVTGVDPRIQTMVLASNLALVGLIVWLDARYPHAGDAETEPTWQQNERLEATQDRHLRELEALHAIAAAGVEATNEDELISRATQVVGKSLFPINFGVLLIDYERGELVHHSSYSEQEIKEQSPIPLGEGITGLVALSGQAMRISDVSREPRYISVDSDARSELCVPIQIGTRVLGVINVESHEVNAFNQADENLLLTLADQLALALEKIRLLSEAQGRARKLTQTLQQQEELNELKDEFIQTVSNEFRTPLVLISGYLEMLNSAESGRLAREYEEPLSIITQRVEYLSKLVEDLAAVLDLRHREQRFDAVDLTSLVNGMAPEIERLSERKGLNFSAELEGEVRPVFGEATLLQKAIYNLVENAIKFTPEGGQVTLRLRQEKDLAMLEVEDSGMGIPAKDYERIFERFYQVEQASGEFGGTGLGLALVREIVGLHEGRVGVSSQPGVGSRFTVFLPVVEEAESK